MSDLMRKVLCIAVLLAPAACASPITFLQFLRGQDFLFTDWGDSVSLDAGEIPVEVYVDLEPGFAPPELAGPQKAKLSMHASGSSPAQLYGSFLVQELDDAGNVIQIILDTAYHGMTNVLTVRDFSATLSGAQKSGAANLSATGTDIRYTSDFTTFGAGEQDFSFSFSSVSPRLARSTDGHVATFRAAGTGTFDTTVPEPAGMALCGGLLIGLSLLMRKLAARR